MLQRAITLESFAILDEWQLQTTIAAAARFPGSGAMNRCETVTIMTQATSRTIYKPSITFALTALPRRSQG